ncbi:hypothetical protein [Paenibacillus dendritiformis]|uniref:hypothetical protein n=1 Tax=Paenibacillus dendritiformis TaxID=130049 RepID=UPI0011B646CB|nr:hypothetical protein [Paenibacillus dendritiformis]
MSLSYLPWQVYIIIAIGGSLITIVYALREARNSPKTIVIGLLLLGFSGILTAIHKFLETKFNKVPILIGIMVIIGFIGITLFFIGAYKKTKGDPERHKVIRICIYTIIGSLTAMGIIALLVIYR